MAIILGPQDAQLQLATVAVPANNANNLSGVLDLQAVGPFSDAKHLGMIAVTVPAMPELTSGSLTLQIQVAEPSLTASPIAPALPVPGAFANANPSQIGTITGAAGGPAAQTLYFFIPLDANGNAYQYVQFLQTATGPTNGEIVTYAWIDA